MYIIIYIHFLRELYEFVKLDTLVIGERHQLARIIGSILNERAIRGLVRVMKLSTGTPFQ